MNEFYYMYYYTDIVILHNESAKLPYQSKLYYLN